MHALAGAVLLCALAASTRAAVGPFDASLAVRPSLDGETVVHVAPLGTVTLDSHDSPVRVEARIEELRVSEAEAIARRPSLVHQVADDVAADARSALRSLLLRAGLVSLIGGVLGAMLASRTWRSALAGAGAAAGLVVVIGGLTLATWRPQAIAEPRYTGLLTVAPRAIGDVESVVQRFGEYRAQLAELVGNVVTVYRAAESLPAVAAGENEVRLLHMSDIHLNPQAFDVAEELIDRFDVDAVVDTGDLTDWGTDVESTLLGRIGRLGVPYVYVRGNHDSGATQVAVAGQPNAVVLDGTGAEVAGLSFFGLGDPRYTPDKGDDDHDAALERAGTSLRRLLRRARPDVLLVHDPLLAELARVDVPLVLAGHKHDASLEELEDGGLLLIQGSSGGAGLRGLQGEEPEPLTMSILYFDGTADELVAVDQVTIRGVGDPDVRVQRHVVDRDR